MSLTASAYDVITRAGQPQSPMNRWVYLSFLQSYFVWIWRIWLAMSSTILTVFYELCAKFGCLWILSPDDLVTRYSQLTEGLMSARISYRNALVLESQHKFFIIIPLGKNIGMVKSSSPAKSSSCLSRFIHPQPSLEQLPAPRRSHQPGSDPGSYLRARA